MKRPKRDPVQVAYDAAIQAPGAAMLPTWDMLSEQRRDVLRKVFAAGSESIRKRVQNRVRTLHGMIEKQGDLIRKVQENHGRR